MVKQRNRRGRIALIEQKFGIKAAQLFYTSTDREVKQFVDIQYDKLINMRDFNPDIDSPVCKKCCCVIKTEFHTYCGCGKDCATYE